MPKEEKITCVFCLSTKPFIHVHGAYQCTGCGARIEPREDGVFTEDAASKEENLEDEAMPLLLAS